MAVGAPLWLAADGWLRPGPEWLEGRGAGVGGVIQEFPPVHGTEGLKKS